MRIVWSCTCRRCGHTWTTATMKMPEACERCGADRGSLTMESREAPEPKRQGPVRD